MSRLKTRNSRQVVVNVGVSTETSFILQSRRRSPTNADEKGWNRAKMQLRYIAAFRKTVRNSVKQHIDERYLGAIQSQCSRVMQVADNLISELNCLKRGALPLSPTCNDPPINIRRHHHEGQFKWLEYITQIIFLTNVLAFYTCNASIKMSNWNLTIIV
jgi:hypothetical protein